MSRTKKSLINLSISMFGQLIGILVSFIARIFFIRILGTEYLGINGLFTNVLAMLSLIELGIGPAIVYSLYEPLAEKNTKKVKALMLLYKKAYIIIGFIIAVSGTCLMPFLNYIIKDVPDVPKLNIIFILFVINSSISYFFAYKRNLIIADQNRYIDTIYHYTFFAILNISQIILLYFTKSYIFYLILQITFTFFENIVISRQANKMYPFLKERSNEKLDVNTYREIRKNTGAMVLHKIGGIVVNSTSNIIISIKVGIVWVGLYSNYQLIISALNSIIGQLFTAITASVGNLGATESKKSALVIFDCINFANFWICGLSSICLLYLLNPFIMLWLGKDLLMSMDIIFVVILSFYVNGMRRSVLTFRDAFGLFWYDRYKPLFEVVINLAVSISLAPTFGIVGVIAGTFVSTLTTCFWIEPYVLYINGFEAPLKLYFFKYFLYTLVTVFAGYITGIFIRFIILSTILAFIYKFIICMLVPNIIFIILFYRTREFKYLFSILETYIFKIIKKGG